MKYILVSLLIVIIIYNIYKRWDEYTGKKAENPNDWWNDKGSNLD
ncbi:hypothetical protein [uncultured Psychroserpens sp.]|nr:hypothetical protein [uncultured Psychroserpens sp.]